MAAVGIGAMSVDLSASATAAPSAASIPNAATATVEHPASTNAAGERSTASAATPAILVLGDSLSAEYGLDRGTGWVPLLAKRLEAQPDEHHYSVSNASISGDTTSGGLSRLPALLARVHPAIVIVELGANDALRGIPVATTRSNLTTIVQLAQAHHAKVLLVGMQIPPNYGPAYTQAFAALFPAISARFKTALVPFLLNGIADKPELFQADQMHPIAQAQPVLLENVWKPLQSLIHAG